MFLPVKGFAQSAEGEITSEPICFVLKNTAPYGVMGTIATNYFTTADGVRDSHKSNFRFDAAGSTNPDTGAPTDRRQICTAGPFFDGRKIRITLRTLFPIFECKTAIDRGEVTIKGFRKDDGGTQTEIECY